jgi:hypothetical protein
MACWTLPFWRGWRRPGTGRTKAQRSQAWIDRQLGKVDASLKAMNKGLGDKPYCVGIHLSLADIAVGCALGYLDFRFPRSTGVRAAPQPAQIAGQADAARQFCRHQAVLSASHLFTLFCVPCRRRIATVRVMHAIDKPNYKTRYKCHDCGATSYLPVLVTQRQRCPDAGWPVPLQWLPGDFCHRQSLVYATTNAGV